MESRQGLFVILKNNKVIEKSMFITKKDYFIKDCKIFRKIVYLKKYDIKDKKY